MKGAAVVLAAGGGSRFGGDVHKLSAPLRGRPVVWWSVRAALDSGIGPVWVVTGAVELDAIVPDGAETLPNPHWPDGQAGSLAVAVDAARRAGLDFVVVGLGDQPFTSAGAWQALAASNSDIAVATYDGRRRNPVRLGAAVWDLLPTTGDEGARVLMRNRPELVVEVPCPGDPADIDTREDLARWS